MVLPTPLRRPLPDGHAPAPTNSMRHVCVPTEAITAASWRAWWRGRSWTPPFFASSAPTRVFVPVTGLSGPFDMEIDAVAYRDITPDPGIAVD
ncbi:hypothetical protein [Microbacterium tenebrionis]|uniref:hypothetical protein n=1 Tax=Microbacterium tenebrionis TaxID=2830665 RepID=UPI00158B1D3F|nr:hypothetical protein [Microbacterium ihumii]